MRNYRLAVDQMSVLDAKADRSIELAWKATHDMVDADIAAEDELVLA